LTDTAHAATEREVEVDDDRQEREKTEDDEVRRDEHPADSRHAERALQRAHWHVHQVEDRAGDSGGGRQ
jgi:hypothetical protein